jgi:hypothetical protein
MGIFGLAGDRLLILVGLAVILFVVLIILKFVFKLTMNFVKLGCLGIFVILAIASILLWMLPG